MISTRRDICRADLDFLFYLADREDFAAFKESLRNPSMADSSDLFGLSVKVFSEKTAAIKKHLPPESGLDELFDLHLVTHCLLFTETIPKWTTQWICDNLDVGRMFSDLTLDELKSGRWAAVPVLLVLGGAEINYFIVGSIPHAPKHSLWPDWVDPVLDVSAKEAVRKAAESIRGASAPAFFCYPLTVANRTTQICGSSLCLALALGFFSTARGILLPGDIGASGGLGKDGRIEPIEHLDQKAACLQKKGFRVFIYPSRNRRPEALSSIELLPVADLDEAFIFIELYEPGNSRSLMLLAEMMKDPKAFINTIDRVDPIWIDWAAREGKWGAVMNALIGSAGLFSDYVDKIQRLQREWKLDAAASVSGLLSTEMLKEAAKNSPLSAFKFCTQKLALANHRGDVTHAQTWAETAEGLFDRALKGDIDACVNFINNRFVTRHNRFEFEPGFPERLQAVLSCLENRYRAQCGGGCSTDSVIGELYGTIAQNFGFCGPAYLDRCEKYAVLAVSAFGGGEVSELKNEMLRIHAYMMYAYLDAGLSENAREALFRYLQICDWKDMERLAAAGRISRWHHAALARFLADTGQESLLDLYFHRGFGLAESLMETAHPWQLWAHNMARIFETLGKPEKAEHFLKKSLRICLSEKNGPTIRVMALLSLSGLKRCGGSLTGGWKENVASIRDAAVDLNPDFFGAIAGKEADEVLDTVRKAPGQLFPFTYR